MTSRRETAVELVNALYDAGRWRECLAACVKAIGAERDPELGDWYSLRTVLASVAVELEGSPDSEAANTAAIGGMEEVVRSTMLSEADQRRGLAFRALGYLYSMRESPDRAESHRLSIENYRRAVAILDSTHAAQDWAEAVVGLGTQLLETARMLNREDIMRDASAVESAKKNVSAAISSFESALAVYTDEKFPEDRDNTLELIQGALQILDILNREERLLH